MSIRGICHLADRLAARLVALDVRARHVAAVVTGDHELLASGENHWHGPQGQRPLKSVHAEQSAVGKLPSLPSRRKLVKVHLLVMRVSKSGQLGNSRPCMHCVLQLCQRLPRKGYTLDKVFYSNSERGITTTTLLDLAGDDSAHRSRFYASH